MLQTDADVSETILGYHEVFECHQIFLSLMSLFFLLIISGNCCMLAAIWRDDNVVAVLLS